MKKLKFEMPHCEARLATIKGTLTWEEIANIVGTATETVIRLLSELKGRHIVALEGKSTTPSLSWRTCSNRSLGPLSSPPLIRAGRRA